MNNLEKCWIAVALSILALGGQRARAENCESPPYRDTRTQYERFIREYTAESNEKFPDVPKDLLQAEAADALKDSCRGKFEHGTLESFHRVGITDREISTNPTTRLAALLIARRDQRRQSKKAALDEPALAPSPNPPENRIYALFLCHPNGYCEIRGEVHIGSVHDTYEERPYDSLRACRSAAYANSSGRVPNAEGRTMLSDGSWWECRSNPIDTWERDSGH